MIFDWNLFLILVLVSMPGIFLAARGGMATLERFIASSGEDQKLPPKYVLMVLTFLQTTVLISIAVAIGTAFSERVGLAAPVFQAAAAGNSVWPVFQRRQGRPFRLRLLVQLFSWECTMAISAHALTRRRSGSRKGCG